MRKFIAPIVIVILAIVIICLYVSVILFAPTPVLLKLVIGVAVLALIGAFIAVLVERIKEIWEEDKDDLSKY